MSEQQLTNDYTDGSYLAKNPTWHSERSAWKASQVRRGLKACNLSPKSICDIGGGTGLALYELLKQLEGVERAVNFEPSQDAPKIDEVEARVERRVEDATQSQERFDLAIMLDVFEHVEDYFGFLRSCSKLARYFAFHIPLDANALTIVGNAYRSPRTAVRHLHYYTRFSALATLEETNYQVLHWHYTPRAWGGPDRNPWKPVNLVRRALNVVSPELVSRCLGGLSLLVVAKSTAFQAP